MAETLGSLVDKLSIKNLRIWHLDEVLEMIVLRTEKNSRRSEIWLTDRGRT